MRCPYCNKRMRKRVLGDRGRVIREVFVCENCRYTYNVRNKKKKSMLRDGDSERFRP